MSTFLTPDEYIDSVHAWLKTPVSELTPREYYRQCEVRRLFSNEVL